MADQCLIAEYENVDDAAVALQVLETDDFTAEQVSYVSRNSEAKVGDVGELKNHDTASPPTGKSLAGGAATGAAIAAPLSTATLIGPFMVAGPLAAMAVGATTGALLSGTQRWGVDHDIANDYEQRALKGSVLVLVHDVDEIRIQQAERLLKTTGPRSLETFRLE